MRNSQSLANDLHSSFVLTTMKPTRISAHSLVALLLIVLSGIPMAMAQTKPAPKPMAQPADPITSKINPTLTPDGLKPDTLYPTSNLVKDRRFVYQLITQEYITNENDYFLDIKLDTCFLIFTAMEGERMFKMVYSADEYGAKPWIRANGLQTLPFEIRFNERGAVEELSNWRVHRDAMMTSMSVQAQNKIITSEEFDIQRVKMNNEKIMRRLAMEDLMYLFELSDDSIREDSIFARGKGVKNKAYAAQCKNAK